jgi:hypothetical protein
MNRDVACKHFNLLKVIIAKRGKLQMGCLSSGNLKEEKVKTTSFTNLVLCGGSVKQSPPLFKFGGGELSSNFMRAM